MSKTSKASRFLIHLKAWNRWRKRIKGHKTVKFLVLFNQFSTPTFEIEKGKIYQLKGFKEAFKEVKDERYTSSYSYRNNRG